MKSAKVRKPTISTICIGEGHLWHWESWDFN